MSDTPTETVWPEPAPEPEHELGEDPQTNLLPTLARIRAMTREERQDLVQRVRDWDGPLVAEFRRRVQGLDG